MDALAGVTEGPSIVSFHLSVAARDNGEVTFGGVDTSKFIGNIQFLPVTSLSFWQFDISQATFQISGTRGAVTQGKLGGSLKKAIAGNQSINQN